MLIYRENGGRLSPDKLKNKVSEMVTAWHFITEAETLGKEKKNGNKHEKKIQ